MRMRSKKQWLWVGGGTLALVLALAAAKAGQIVTMVRANESFAPPPEAVTSAKVEVARAYLVNGDCDNALAWVACTAWYTAFWLRLARRSTVTALLRSANTSGNATSVNPTASRRGKERG